MKKKLLFLLSLVILENTVFAQADSFLDNFESYEVGDYLCLNSDKWVTWLDLPGSTQDIVITDEKSDSGSKAIKFLDLIDQPNPYIILPYHQEKIISGALNSNISLFVETSAKLNYKANAEVNPSTSLKIEFKTEGVGVVKNNNNDVILTFEYPKSEWFTFELDVNFEANKWHLEINENCVGTFANNLNSIASLHFYPTHGDSYFVDDFSYSYINSDHEIKNDARTTLKSSQLMGFEGDRIEFFGEIINGGSKVIKNAEFSFKFGESEIPVNFSNLDIKNGESFVFQLEDEFYLSNQTIEAKLEISRINDGAFLDEDFCNDDSNLILRGVSPAEHKKVVMEQATATWCFACPMGSVRAKYMLWKYPNRYIPIVVHISDPMAFSDYESNLPISYISEGIVNREYYIYPDTSEKVFLNEIQHESLTSSIHGAKFDQDSRELQISLVTTSLDLITDQYKVNLVLTEDEVQGVGQQWNQINGFSGKEDLIDIDGTNWKDLPPVIPAEQMKYNHVARAILAPYTGLENSFEEDLDNGEEKLFNFSYIVPEEFDLSKMNVISMLINPDGTINTGERTSVMKALENGYMSLTSTDNINLTNASYIYPNPTNGTSFIAMNLSKHTDIEVQLLDLTGRVMLEKNFENSIGYFITSFETSNIPVGNYIVKIRAGDQFTAKKLAIAR